MKSRILALSAATIAAVAGIALYAVPSQATAGQAAKASASAFNVDGAHSSVVFKIKHNDVAWFYGRFNDLKGVFTVEPESGAIEITVNAESVNSGNEKRDNHLRSPDFFSSKEFPTITFVSKSLKKTGETTFDATGDLTLHGVTKEITVPVEVTGRGEGRRGEIAGLHTTFTINRADYGMGYMQGRGLGDDVTLIVALEGGAAQ